MVIDNIKDIVICGPDMSGTSTQIKDFIKHFQSQGKIIRDMCGTEIDALFHAERFQRFNQNYISLQEFLKDENVPQKSKDSFLFQSYQALSGFNTKEGDLLVASMVKNNKSTYVDPNSADIWIFEEPTRRGSGQVNRVIEQNRSLYGSTLHPFAAALSHQNYRTPEYLRFRKILREKGILIIKSRSEESACYQVYDSKALPNGISLEEYLRLPGHEIAFSHPPTHLFIVCGPENWTAEEYIELKKQRSGDRELDDHEMDVPYQLLVNKRYAGNWIKQLYGEGAKLYGSKIPEIFRFDIYYSKEETKFKMISKLKEIGL